VGTNSNAGSFHDRVSLPFKLQFENCGFHLSRAHHTLELCVFSFDSEFFSVDDDAAML
jgi:hypothetical protein